MKMPKHIVLRVDVEGTTISLANVTKGVEVCEDSISRKQVLTYIADTQLLKSGESTFDGATACDWLFDYIKELPSVIPSRPKGKWMREGGGYADAGIVYDIWHCSECDHFEEDEELALPNFCPNCGADMRRASDE